MKVIARATQYITVLMLTLFGSVGTLLSPQAAEALDAPGRARPGFMLALPRVEISYDRDGIPSIGPLNPVLLSKITRGLVPSDTMKLPAGWVDYFVSTDTQHLELMQKDDGLYIWINGKRLPNIAYDQATLNNLSVLTERSDSLQAIGLSRNEASFVSRSLPALRRLGLNLLLRFPSRDDSTPIDARSVKLKTSAVTTATKPTATGAIKVAVVYDDNGDATLHGMSTADFTAIFGVEPKLLLALEPNFISELKRRNIQHVSLRSEGDGLAVQINGKALPSMQCAAECLENLGQAFGALNTYPDLEQLNAPMQAFMPMLRTIDAQLVLRFPAPAGVEPLDPGTKK
jgi:hypothetical protein